MTQVTIGTELEEIGNLRDRLRNELENLTGDGVVCALNEHQQGTFTFLQFVGEVQDTQGEWAVRRGLAQALTGFILDDLGRVFIDRFVRRKYFRLSESDRTKICRAVRESVQIDGDQQERDCGNPVSSQRRTQVMKDLLAYLDFNDILVIDGFVRFRLTDYLRELEEAALEAAEEYIVESEYREFVGLLRYFVDLQEPQVEEVDIVVRPRGLYRLLYPDGNVVDNEYLEGFVVDLVEDQVDYEDLLISALITLAPNRILCHFDERGTLAKTLRSVFEGRVRFCPGCRRCDQSKANLEMEESFRRR